MAYGLRAKADLKRPTRYTGDLLEEEKQELEPEFTSATKSFGKCPVNGSYADSYQRPNSLSPFPLGPMASLSSVSHAPALPLSPLPPRPTINSQLHSRSSQSVPPQYTHRLPHARNMQANPKHYYRNKRAREDDETTDESDVTALPRRPTVQSRRQSVESESEALSIYPSLRPAAFPTKSAADGPIIDALKDAHMLSVQGQQYARRLMEARVSSDQKRIKACHEVVDRLYACKQPIDEFTAGDKKQRSWYAQLNQQWSARESSVEVTFVSLWPSLRQEIIERIRDEFPVGSFYDSYHPVQVILQLSKSELTRIINDNGKDWGEDEIPEYLQEYKRHHPNEAIDPDLPPPCEVVKAIKFLKQSHLAGNLLGIWQTPLPATKYFLSWKKIRKITTQKTEIQPSVPSRPAFFQRPTPKCDAFLKRYLESHRQANVDRGIITGSRSNSMPIPNGPTAPNILGDEELHDIESEELNAAKQTVSSARPANTNRGNIYVPATLRVPPPDSQRHRNGHTRQISNYAASDVTPSTSSLSSVHRDKRVKPTAAVDLSASLTPQFIPSDSRSFLSPSRNPRPRQTFASTEEHVDNSLSPPYCNLHPRSFYEPAEDQAHLAMLKYCFRPDAKKITAIRHSLGDKTIAPPFGHQARFPTPSQSPKLSMLDWLDNRSRFDIATCSAPAYAQITTIDMLAHRELSAELDARAAQYVPPITAQSILDSVPRRIKEIQPMAYYQRMARDTTIQLRKLSKQMGLTRPSVMPPFRSIANMTTEDVMRNMNIPPAQLEAPATTSTTERPADLHDQPQRTFARQGEPLRLRRAAAAASPATLPPAPNQRQLQELARRGGLYTQTKVGTLPPPQGPFLWAARMLFTDSSVRAAQRRSAFMEFHVIAPSNYAAQRRLRERTRAMESQGTVTAPRGSGPRRTQTASTRGQSAHQVEKPPASPTRQTADATQFAFGRALPPTTQTLSRFGYGPEACAARQRKQAALDQDQASGPPVPTQALNRFGYGPEATAARQRKQAALDQASGPPPPPLPSNPTQNANLHHRPIAQSSRAAGPASTPSHDVVMATTVEHDTDYETDVETDVELSSEADMSDSTVDVLSESEEEGSLYDGGD